MKKIIAYLYFGTCFSMMLCVPVYAYIDPSVMTYAVQAIAGILITLGAVVGIYWRKAKKKLQNKMGIDEMRNKEVESDEIDFSKDRK